MRTPEKPIIMSASIHSAPTPTPRRRSLSSSSSSNKSCTTTSTDPSTMKPKWLLSILADVEEKMKMLGCSRATAQQEIGDTFAERAEAYYKRRPQLLSLLRDLYNSYLTLSDRYIQTVAKTQHHRPPSSQISVIDNDYYDYDDQEEEEDDAYTSHIDSDVESSLSYQQLPPTLLLAASVATQHDETMLFDLDSIVTEIVVKNVEYDILLDEANMTERRYKDASRKIELQKSPKIQLPYSLPQMKMSISRLNLFLLFFHLLILQFSPRISAIRKDVGFQGRRICKNTVLGRYLLSDDNGHVCDALSLNPQSRCCPEKGEKFSCHGCNVVSECCDSYEYCVSCCLNPSRIKEEQVMNVKVAKPATAGKYSNVFDFCAGRCRHNSESVVHENAYLSDFHHCFSLPSNSSAANYTFLEARLNGINVLVGRRGQSCDSVCKSKGQSCVPNKLLVLNQCDIMQKYMSCKGTCLASIGPDQPAEVVDDAPEDLNPGACLFTQTQSMLSCYGSHQHTRRLCPCA